MMSFWRVFGAAIPANGEYSILHISALSWLKGFAVSGFEILTVECLNFWITCMDIYMAGPVELLVCGDVVC